MANFYSNLIKDFQVSISYHEKERFVKFVKEIYKRGWFYSTNGASTLRSQDHPFIRILYDEGVAKTNAGIRSACDGCFYPDIERVGITRSGGRIIYPLLLKVDDEWDGGVNLVFKEGCSREEYIRYIPDVLEVCEAVGIEYPEWLRAEVSAENLKKKDEEICSLSRTLEATNSKVEKLSAELIELRQDYRKREEIALAMAETMAVRSELAFANLKLVVQKAITDLAETKGISKSLKFAEIRESLEAAIYPLNRGEDEDWELGGEG